jgi:CheY-like chemotaxis protein
MNEIEPLVSPTDLRPCLLLVCDDNSDIRAMVRAMLERRGYSVIAVGTGQAALAQLASVKPAAILIDLLMPGMDGRETMAAIRNLAAGEDIPIIILSAFSRKECLDLQGHKEWVQKPIHEPILLEALERTLGARGNVKVLVVEDDADLATLLLEMFHRNGYETFHCRTGQDAVQVLQEITPDLLVLDIMLPEGDGFGVVSWLRQHQHLCKLPLVVYTGRDLGHAERERLKLGPTEILTKGRITPEQFEQHVLEFIARVIPTKPEDHSYAEPTHPHH